ncbi:UNVERIFIED_CONTAM: hypothetical protein FKN15_022101 [Acipenser sinensis]
MFVFSRRLIRIWQLPLQASNKPRLHSAPVHKQAPLNQAPHLHLEHVSRDVSVSVLCV